ncbi:hypothetical protein Q7P37_005918 [Cladosporium fusiforme]
MDNYSLDIMRALGALNKQRNDVLKSKAINKEDGEQSLEGRNLNGRWVDSALAAIDARRQRLTAIMGVVELADANLDVEELLQPLALPSPDASSVLSDPEVPSVSTDETGEQADDSDWDTIPTDEEDTEPTRRKGNNGVTFSDYGGVSTLINSPTICKLKDGSYVELRCDVCGGNTSWAHNKIISGVRGFQVHFRLMHHTTVKVDAVLRRCTFRDVPVEEVERIINGQHKIECIHCESKVNLQSDMVYIGQSAVGSGSVPKRGARMIEDLAAARDNEDSNAAAVPKQKRKRTTQTDESGVNPSTPASSKPKKSLKRDHSAPHLSNCPIIVQTTEADDEETAFIELRCDVCHGNGSFSSGKLLYGIKGFKAHYREIHKEHLSTSEILTRCRHREVPLEEVKAIQAGTKGMGFVKCEGSPNVRPKKSYRNFVVKAV